MPKLQTKKKLVRGSEVATAHPLKVKSLRVVCEDGVTPGTERRRYFVGDIQVAFALIRLKEKSLGHQVWFTSLPGSTEFKDPSKIITAVVAKLET